MVFGEVFGLENIFGCFRNQEQSSVAEERKEEPVHFMYGCQWREDGCPYIRPEGIYFVDRADCSTCDSNPNRIKLEEEESE